MVESLSCGSHSGGEVSCQARKQRKERGEGKERREGRTAGVITQVNTVNHADKQGEMKENRG